ncbi:hypothetical protein RND81_12G197500 [Saponaria officinalis]|uniref:Uncharacterized protein n=1 Tax=Saponaria officinalis TaxID=3572 RepID=A0AAW1HD23_SAPOF
MMSLKMISSWCLSLIFLTSNSLRRHDLSTPSSEAQMWPTTILFIESLTASYSILLYFATFPTLIIVVVGCAKEHLIFFLFCKNCV